MWVSHKSFTVNTSSFKDILVTHVMSRVLFETETARQVLTLILQLHDPVTSSFNQFHSCVTRFHASYSYVPNWKPSYDLADFCQLKAKKTKGF